MDDQRRLAAANSGMVIGFFLFCLSSLGLIICCCCLRNKETPKFDEKGLDLVETDSSGSESSNDTAALDLFLKGRQAAMAEGLRGEPMDSFATGYVDGTIFASERKEPLADAQVLKQAKKLGYVGPSADAYVQGFQLGVRSGLSTESPDQRNAYESGLLNAEARGLSNRDREAYARGYALGDSSQQRFENDADLIAKAESFDFTGPHAELFAAGYNDGVDGINVTDVLSPTAAFQKGLSNAAALGLSDDDALAHATGFRDGYAFALVGDGTQVHSKSDMLAKAAEAGLTGEAANWYCASFEEGVDEGNTARKRLFLKGMDRAESFGMSGNFQSAFAAGYKDGCANASTGQAIPGDQALKENARNLQILDDDEVNAYIRGFKDGNDSMSNSSTATKDILLPEAIFEKGFTESRDGNNDEEAAAARASGRHDGYCYGLTGGAIKQKAEILDMADTLGFEGYDADIYVAGFQVGAIEGNAARDAAYQKGKRKASSLDMSGETATAYANGHRDGQALVISGDVAKDLSESAIKKRAKKLGITGKLVPFYVNGFQDGQRDGHESLAACHVFSSGASYAKGLIDGKAQGMTGDVRDAYANGYRDGYQMGINGSEKPGEEDLLASAVESEFDNRKTQTAFKKGFTDGFDDGLDTRQTRAGRVLSPTAALERGHVNASALDLKGEASNAFTNGFSDGYALGLAGHQCPKDDKLLEKASDLGFSSTRSSYVSDSRLPDHRTSPVSDGKLLENASDLGFSSAGSSYVSGFHQGFKQGAAGSINKNILGLGSDAALMKGQTKAENHGMKGPTADAYGNGYQDGYNVGLKGTQHDITESSELSRNDLAKKARNHGIREKTQVHAYIAGHLAGQADGGAVVLHHSLLDVHRCVSTTCQSCRQMKEPTFIQVAHGYRYNPDTMPGQRPEPSWWKKHEEMDIV